MKPVPCILFAFLVATTVLPARPDMIIKINEASNFVGKDKTTAANFFAPGEHRNEAPKAYKGCN